MNETRCTKRYTERYRENLIPASSSNQHFFLKKESITLTHLLLGFGNWKPSLPPSNKQNPFPLKHSLICCRENTDILSLFNRGVRYIFSSSS